MITFKSTKGFTLIELLVVISIIGLISSVVLSALGTARTKGANAAIKAQLAGLRVAAEQINDADPVNHYFGVCTNTAFVAAVTAAHNNSAAYPSGTLSFTGSSNQTGPTMSVCHSTTNSWAVSIPLKAAEGTTVYWCTDVSGYSIGRVSPLPGIRYTCPDS